MLDILLYPGSTMDPPWLGLEKKGWKPYFVIGFANTVNAAFIYKTVDS